MKTAAPNGQSLTEEQFISSLEMAKGMQYHVPHSLNHLPCGCCRPEAHSKYPTLWPYNWREWYVEFDVAEGVFIHTECRRSITRPGSRELEDSWYARTVIKSVQAKQDAA